ncbi:hypothetical protein KCP69_19330 [Salmonella enterica subsp. enterica]|nr:hypothetical protein KCP69_19330 [Salmonella enterica subsp. enterica]
MSKPFAYLSHCFAVFQHAKFQQLGRRLNDGGQVVVLVFVDENPEKLVQRRSFAVHGRAQVIVPIDDFPGAKSFAQAFLLDVPAC